MILNGLRDDSHEIFKSPILMEIRYFSKTLSASINEQHSKG